MLGTLKCLVACLAFSLILGCGGSQKGVRTPNCIKGAPDWVRKGCSAFKGQKQWVCGVGIMENTRSFSMCRDEALERGRDEIGKTLHSATLALRKSYRESQGAAFGQEDEYLVRNVTETASKATLRGSRLEDTWVSDAEGCGCFVLAVLDFEAVKTSLTAAAAADSKFQQHIRENAEKAFEEAERRAAELQ